MLSRVKLIGWLWMVVIGTYYTCSDNGIEMPVRSCIILPSIAVEIAGNLTVQAQLI